MKLTIPNGWKILQRGTRVYCKANVGTFKCGSLYTIHDIQLINGNETLFIMVGDDDFPYQFYTIGTSLLFVNYFTQDLKEIRKMKLDKLNW